jgi:mRNA-degrading endonuclease RelE of RelBE toxin-antitoxin system
VSRFAWTVAVPPEARRRLAALPPKAAFAILEAIEAIALDPRRLGKELHFELEGHLSARRGPYRIVYRPDDAKQMVHIVTVGHRADVYRR